MPRTSRVTLDRQQEVSDRPQAEGATQAGVPSEQQMQASSKEDKPTPDEKEDKPTLDEIAEEAYAIYLAHGAQHGFDIDHWLEAERRIAARKQAAANPQDVAADNPNDRK